MRTYLNRNWDFTSSFTDDCLREEFKYEKKVSIPHSVALIPYHYGDEQLYQMLSGYRKSFFVPKSYQGKKLLLTFEGAAHFATVYINGQKVGENDCGYTAFTFSIESYVKYDCDNTIVVRLDSREQLNQPPFGFVIDYMTYGGIYRDVYLDVKEPIYIQDVFLKPTPNLTTKKSTLSYEISINGVELACKEAMFQDKLHVELLLIEKHLSFTSKNTTTKVLGSDDKNKITLVDTVDTGEVTLWDPNSPYLYHVQVSLFNDKTVLDQQTIQIGYREAVFTKDGFYINNNRYKIRGLNRHQSFPYMGYAAPKHLQEEDARILKEELGLNSVRTSHYPQSQYFLDECDRLGLLVFTEIPGWQHIGNEKWKNIAIHNVERMIVQNRNHPSIVLWGVRINESVDDDSFYTKTNQVAHQKDNTRQTGGVRCITKSHLLEDVYTYNDFVHEGDNQAILSPKKVTTDTNKAYLISEYNGHMFPTKSFDTEARRRDHAIRHANVLEAVSKNNTVAGSFGWCAFDYNTHKDFGSGDRICYHGVCDMFRNPKLAAFVYAVEAETKAKAILELSGNFEIGEYSGGQVGKTYIITNCESVKMYKNNVFIKEYSNKDSPYKALQHGPISIDDYIGDQLTLNEKFSARKSQLVKAVIHAGMMYGSQKLPFQIKLKAFLCLVVYRMSIQELTNLYEKYIGGCGADKNEYRFEGFIHAEKVITKVCSPMTKLHLELITSKELLTESTTYDTMAVRIRVVDENNNIAHFYNDPVTTFVEGPTKVVGSTTFSLNGGIGGTYLTSKGKAGESVITFSSGKMTKSLTIITKI